MQKYWLSFSCFLKVSTVSAKHSCGGSTALVIVYSRLPEEQNNYL